MCTKHSWFWLTPDRVSYRRQIDLTSRSHIWTTRSIPFTECPCIITAYRLVLPTLECWIQILKKSLKLLRFRTTSDSVLVLVPKLPGWIVRLTIAILRSTIHHGAMTSLNTFIQILKVVSRIGSRIKWRSARRRNSMRRNRLRREDDSLSRVSCCLEREDDSLSRVSSCLAC